MMILLVMLAKEISFPGPGKGLSIFFTLPHALTLGPAHWDPAHAASKTKNTSIIHMNRCYWDSMVVIASVIIIMHIPSMFILSTILLVCVCYLLVMFNYYLSFSIIFITNMLFVMHMMSMYIDIAIGSMCI